MATHTNDAVRLVQRRMADLRLDMKALSELDGAPSYNAIRFFLQGRRDARPQTLRKLETVLALELDIAQAVGQCGR